MPELLIGCGHSRHKKVAVDGKHDWNELVTLDRYAECEPHVVHDLESLPYPFPDNHFDELHAYCVLEHCGRQGDWRFFFDQFTEFWRIAKPGATFHALVPRHDSPWAWGDPSHTRIISLETLGFLSQAFMAEHVGEETPMSDFRWYYKADWLCVAQSLPSPHHFGFVLRAIK